MANSYPSAKGNHVIVLDVFLQAKDGTLIPAGQMWTVTSNEEDVPAKGTTVTGVALTRDDQGFWKFA